MGNALTDTFARHTRSLTSPPEHALEIAPGEADLPQATRALYVGVAGDLAVRMLGGAAVTLRNVPAGSLLPLRVRRVLPATSAGGLVGLW
jgi:hypothetical protein